jgi:replicative DNA helicase Mcm
LTAILKAETARPEDVFQDFFRSYESDQIGSKYRKRLAQVAVTNGKSLLIDFEDLIAFDPALARSVVERPDDYITYASSAATAQMRVEDPEYAEHVGKIFARFRRLPEKMALRKIGSEHIKKLALVEGIVVRSTQVRPPSSTQSFAAENASNSSFRTKREN